MNRICAFDSAYPGSMFERKDGGYIQRDDADSLALALVALVDSGDRAAKEANEALCDMEIERDALKVQVRELRATLMLVMPLARGYAAEHRVGSNQLYIDAAEAVLEAHEDAALDRVATPEGR